MSTSESTCWTVIRAAAAGSTSDRDELARRYLGAVQAYLSARWRGSALRDDLDDATLEVFIDSFRQGGAVEVAGPTGCPTIAPASMGSSAKSLAGSRAGPNVRQALCRKSRRMTSANPVSSTAPWAQAIMAEAARLQRQRAAEVAAAVGVGVDDRPDACQYDCCPWPVDGRHVIYSPG
jgi:RNA polymerase sigma-70 factor (ECF subfamily)